MKLTELEGTVLGVIWTEGPLSTYAVRSRFARSLSAHFSGSAGAIYPLVRRLEREGLVRAAGHRQGRRHSRLYSITVAGKKALRGWMGPPLDDWLAAVEFDPIRARVHFLALLTPARRRRFIEDAIEHMESALRDAAALVAELSESDDEWSTWGARGAQRVQRARLSWLRDIERASESAAV